MTKHTSSNCDIPANNSNNAITRNIAPNSLTTLNITSLIDELECKPPKHILNKGLRIHASKQISEYNIHIGSIHIFFPNVMPKFSHLKERKRYAQNFYVKRIPFRCLYLINHYDKFGNPKSSKGTISIIR